MVSKPIQITIEDTIGFCEQYYSKYQTYKNLFTVIELLLPHNVKWPTVRSYDNQIIRPIVIQRDPANATGKETSDQYHTMFVRQDPNKDYLSKSITQEYIEPADILDADYTAHAYRLQQYYSDAVYTKRLFEARQEINYLQNWLLERNIAHLMFWGCGKGESFHKLVDKAVMPVIKQNRLIPMQTFTCMSKGADWSINPVDSHPDQAGHKRIAKFLSDYTNTHELSIQPNQKDINTLYECC